MAYPPSFAPDPGHPSPSVPQHPVWPGPASAGNAVREASPWKKMKNYLEKVVPQIPDTLIAEVDTLIENARVDSSLFRYLLITLFNYYGKSKITGKPTGIDIKEKKMTLPLIHLLNNSTTLKKRKIINLQAFTAKLFCPGVP